MQIIHKYEGTECQQASVLLLSYNHKVYLIIGWPGFVSRVAEVRLAGVTPSLTARSRVISLESSIIPKSELWASNVSNAFCLGYGCCQ